MLRILNHFTREFLTLTNNITTDLTTIINHPTIFPLIMVAATFVFIINFFLALYDLTKGELSKTKIIIGLCAGVFIYFFAAQVHLPDSIKAGAIFPDNEEFSLVDDTNDLITDTFWFVQYGWDFIYENFEFFIAGTILMLVFTVMTGFASSLIF